MVRIYPKPNGKDENRGFTLEDIRNGEIYLYMDITCPHCGKEQSVAQTNYVGGPCCNCGRLTGSCNGFTNISKIY